MNPIVEVARLIRYRFFLFAGIFPYLLGQSIAFNIKGQINWFIFWLGFLGIFLVLAGVELFNEYFDAQEGGDRIFSKEPAAIPDYFFALGILVFLLAFVIGLYFSFKVGWPILLLSFLGFLGAYFYVGPPVRWAYRGLGEAVIALSYGPFMLLGSFYLQAHRLHLAAFLVSIVCGLLLFSLAIINEVPDYIQDKLVGKRNIVVRVGKERALRIFEFSLIGAFILLGFGICLRIISYVALASFLALPFTLHSIKTARNNLNSPQFLVHPIKSAILTYIIVVFCLFFK